ncbi:alpha-ketoglutarate dehydrogenase component 4 isoform X2 [Stigmatopora argus]
MGSKVSSKMAAPAARVIQAVRPHAPMIKFPSRQDVAKPNAQEALKTLLVHVSQADQPGLAPRPTSSPSRASLPPIPGTPDTLASIRLVPARYRRRALVPEEMEYIQRGGPE